MGLITSRPTTPTVDAARSPLESGAGGSNAPTITSTQLADLKEGFRYQREAIRNAKSHPSYEFKAQRLAEIEAMQRAVLDLIANSRSS